MEHRPHTAMNSADSTPPKNPPIDGRVNADAEDRLLERQRIALSDRQREELAPWYAHLREAFEKLLLRARPYLEDRRLQQPGWEAIQRRVNRFLAQGKAAYTEISRFEQREQTIVPPETIEGVIRDGCSHVDRLMAEFRWIDASASYAEQLHELLGELLTQSTVPSDGYRDLVRQFREDCLLQPAADLLIPPAGFHAQFCWRPSIRRSEPAVYLQGIQAARWMVHVFGDELDTDSTFWWLVLATLLQDAGFLVLEMHYRTSPAELEVERPNAFRRHPSISAALAGGLEDASVMLTKAIAAHHRSFRRFDTGRPRRRVETVAVISRFAQLHQDTIAKQSDVDTAAHPGRSTMLATSLPAASILWQETERGHYDVDIVRKLFAAIDENLTATLQEEQMRRLLQSPSVEDVLERIDMQHELAGPGRHHPAATPDRSKPAEQAGSSQINSSFEQAHEHPPAVTGGAYFRGRRGGRSRVMSVTPPTSPENANG